LNLELSFCETRVNFNPKISSQISIGQTVDHGGVPTLPMSTSALADPISEGYWRHFISRQCDRMLRACAALNDVIPSPLFNRASQMLLDASVAALAMLLAFQLRFDGLVPTRYLPCSGSGWGPWRWPALSPCG
jgi:hypothetical protein